VALDNTAVCAHGKPYGGIEQCGECRKARAVSVRTASPKADLRELELLEDECREAAKYLRRHGRDWVEGTDRERNVGLKAFETALKYDRMAYEARALRVGVEHDQWLRDENMRMRGSGN
jgi:hypothetical protein